MHIFSACNVLKSFSKRQLGSLCLANMYENILDSKSSLSDLSSRNPSSAMSWLKAVLVDCDALSETCTILLVKSLATTVRARFGPTFPCLCGEFAIVLSFELCGLCMSLYLMASRWVL